MTNTRIAIPLHGKMSSRVFHQPLFRERLDNVGFEPLFFLSPHYFRSFEFNPEHYFELNIDAYDNYFSQHILGLLEILVDLSLILLIKLVHGFIWSCMF